MALMKRIFINIFYQIRYKYYQFKNLIKYFPLGKDEENRLKLIDSIDKLVNKLDVAKPSSVMRSGRRGRKFKSSHPDIF
jgi:hypothetical protein